MKRLTPVLFGAVLGLAALPLLAADREEVAAECFAAFARGDQTRVAAIAAELQGWGPIADPRLRKVVDGCVGLAQQAPATAVAPEEGLYPALLARIADDPAATPDVIDSINSGQVLTGLDEPTRGRLEEAILAHVRPLPASEAAANLAAYRALAFLRPENAAYADKITQYTDALSRQAAETEARKSAIVGRLKKHTAEFDGSSWYRHPDSPRYQDTRPYLTLYVLESGTGARSLEFFVNYTADSWLFVRHARLNVDGEFIDLPPAGWSRDNDTEIWEWTGWIATPELIGIARKIAASKRTVIRFEGQEFYDDFVLPATDKRVIADMLAAWEVMAP